MNSDFLCDDECISQIRSTRISLRRSLLFREYVYLNTNLALWLYSLFVHFVFKKKINVFQ